MRLLLASEHLESSSNEVSTLEARRAVAARLREIPEALLADPSNSEAFDVIIECARTTYGPGSLYLRALSARRAAARRGSTIELMRWCREVTRLGTLLQ